MRAVALAGALVLFGLLGRSAGGVPSIADVRAVVDAAGSAGPLIYVAVYALATVALVPGGALTVLAGLLFGPLLGTAVAFTGASPAPRRRSRSPAGWGARIRRLLGDRVQEADAWLAERAFAAMLTLRLVPLVPFNVLNYAAGLTGVAPRAYVAATTLGIIPGAFAYATLGGTAADPLSAPFVGATALVIALTGLDALARRRLPPSRKDAPRACRRGRDGGHGHQPNPRPAAGAEHGGGLFELVDVAAEPGGEQQYDVRPDVDEVSGHECRVAVEQSQADEPAPETDADGVVRVSREPPHLGDEEASSVRFSAKNSTTASTKSCALPPSARDWMDAVSSRSPGSMRATRTLQPITLEHRERGVEDRITGRGRARARSRRHR